MEAPRTDFVRRWETVDRSASEVATVRFENGGFIAEGLIDTHKLQYVIRLDTDWHVRQFLLFRDLDEPDLWLGTDGGGTWGEMNGVVRHELNKCTEIDLALSPLPNSLHLKRLSHLGIGEHGLLTVAVVDCDTLELHRSVQRYTRLADKWWRHEGVGSGTSEEFGVDAEGFVIDYPGMFRRSI